MEMQSPNVSIASMAMLVELRISTWTARKRDDATTDEVNKAKNATDGASNVYKYLMAGSDHLKKIEKYAAKCRAWNGQQTLPWMKGIGLLPMENFFDYRQQLGTMEANFNALVQDFIAVYPSLVSAQAFKLGDYFDANEFPHVDTLPRKFKFEYNFLPVPESGDFRLKCEEAVRADLAEQYDKMFNERLADAMRDPWERLHKTLTHMAERLTDTSEGERNIFRDSLINKPLELCSLLTKLNVTKDPQLEEARRMLEKALSRTDVDDLRKFADAREELRTDVQSIINKFNW